MLQSDGDIMPVTADEVRQAYRMILNRGASAEEIAGNVERHADVVGMRRSFMLSGEFLKKHKELLDGFNAKLRPSLVQIQIPRTASTTLSEALSYETHLLPNALYNHDDVVNLSTMPLAARRGLRYLRGDMPVSVGDTLDIPYCNLIVIRRPGPRIYSLYREIQRNTDHRAHEDVAQNNLSFGEYLEMVLERPDYRREIDNGQLRRLANAYDDVDFDQPEKYVKAALRNALRDGSYFGFTEHLDVLINQLFKDRVLSTTQVENQNVAPAGPSLEAALSQMNDKQLAIYRAFTEWDNYFYELCMTIMPPTKA